MQCNTKMGGRVAFLALASKPHVNSWPHAGKGCTYSVCGPVRAVVVSGLLFGDILLKVMLGHVQPESAVRTLLVCRLHAAVPPDG